MKKTITYALLLCTIIILPFNSHGSTIVPFHNLGEMANASTVVVTAVAGETYDVPTSFQTYIHTRLTVNFVVKGQILPNSILEMEHYSTKGDGWVSQVSGDVALEQGKTYLLFLEQNNRGFWRPILMSYGIFEQLEADFGETYLVPLPEWADLNIIHPSDGQPIEPLAVYRQNDLLHHLQNVVQNTASWDMQRALETTDVSAFLPLDFRAPPSHCTFFNIRWQGFPGSPVNVRTPLAGDPSCTVPITANSYVAAAVANMSVNYPGINLVDAGTYTGFVPDCSDGTAAGNDFNNFVNSTFGGPRNLVVIYNDPCNQLADLVGCSGILGIGGVSGTSPTYTFDGMTYFSAQYGYMIVNNGVCACYGANSYTLMLTHEMTHALGVGHIAGSGTANMNPSCCIPITNLDQQCLNYFYPPALPVELIDFTGKSTPTSVDLHWETASESNNQGFNVERSGDGRRFETIANLAGAGTSYEPKSYHHVDSKPLKGLNYYRLRQMDFDGKTEYSPVISIIYKQDQQRFLSLANPVQENNLRLLIDVEEEGMGVLQIIDNKGGIVDFRQLQLDQGTNFPEVNLEALPSGMYFAKILVNKEQMLLRFVK